MKAISRPTALGPGSPTAGVLQPCNKLPIFQDIKFEFGESQTSRNHSLELQYISNKSPQNLPPEYSESVKELCVC